MAYIRDLAPGMERPRRPTACRTQASRGLLMVCCAALGGCVSSDAASGNLDQMMRPDHGFRYSAPLQGGLQYNLSQLLDSKYLGEDSVLAADRMRSIENPTEVAIENLLDLAQGDLRDPWTAARQVRQYVRYGVFCRSALVRERCMLELARHVSRLDLSAVPEAPAVAASPAEVRSALAALIAAWTSAVEADQEGREGALSDFSSACAACGQLPLDVQGALRVAMVVEHLGRARSRIAALQEPLMELSMELQQLLAARALRRGRTDPAGIVRAAAWRTNQVAYGERFLNEALLALAMTPLDVDGGQTRTVEYGLLAESGADPAPYEVVYGLLKKHGLPHVSAPDPKAQRLLESEQLFVLVRIAYDLSTFDDRTRLGAMQTLGALTGNPQPSLRAEDWERWWQSYRSQLVEDLSAPAGQGDRWP